MPQFTVALQRIADEQGLEIAYAPSALGDIQIATMDVDRPGLLLAGYDEHFENNRIQILGNAEMGYLERLSPPERDARLHALFSACPPCVVVTRGLCPCAGMLRYAEEFGVPVLTTGEATSALISGIISILSVEIAPRITRHGVLVEVYGEGVLILGESGVGKSETAIELLKRGHRLIADDAVELRRVSNRSIIGQAPKNIRHFVELRGIGIINVARVFGAGAVKNAEKVNLVVVLEQWEQGRHYSSMGLEEYTFDILGLAIPTHTIPVIPGRNLAVILEIAAINNRQRTMGYSAAQELMDQLGMPE